MTGWLIVADLLLAAGLTARLTRFVITDDLGEWWIRDPADAWFHRGPRRMRWHKYLVMLTCPWCVGFWIAALTLLSLWAVGGPGHAAEPWRWVTGAFTLNWVVAHIGVRLGDAGYSEDDD